MKTPLSSTSLATFYGDINLGDAFFSALFFLRSGERKPIVHLPGKCAMGFDRGSWALSCCGSDARRGCPRGRALLSHLEFRKVSSLQFFRFSVSALSAAVTSAAVFGQCFLRKHYVVGCR